MDVRALGRDLFLVSLNLRINSIYINYPILVALSVFYSATLFFLSGFALFC